MVCNNTAQSPDYSILLHVTEDQVRSRRSSRDTEVVKGEGRLFLDRITHRNFHHLVVGSAYVNCKTISGTGATHFRKLKT